MHVRTIRLPLLTVAALLVLAAGIAVFAADFGTGMMAYQSGDYATARKEFETLANQGDKDAQLILGDMCAKGQGVAVDVVEAWKWYQLAAASGARDAAQAAAQLGKHMTEAQLTTARERVLNWRPASTASAGEAAPPAPATTSMPSPSPPAPPPASDSGFFSNLARGATGLFGARNNARPPNGAATATIGIRGLSAADLQTAAPNPAALQAMESFAASPSTAAIFAQQARLQVESVPYLNPLSASASPAPSHKVSPLQH